MELREHAAPARPITPGMPYREDCWSEGETSALVDAWGERYLELNRGNLRQKQWQEVADAVNSRIGTTRRKMRTDVQCKNRIDTLKKKYKLEKARLVEGTAVTSSWPFYGRLDALIGATTPASGSGGGGMKRPPPSASYSHSHSLSHLQSPPFGIPLTNQKKGGSGIIPMASPLHGKLPMMPALPTALPVDDTYVNIRKAAAAAAAAASFPMPNNFIRKTPVVPPPLYSGENSFVKKNSVPAALPTDNPHVRKAAAAAAAAKGEAAEEEDEEEESEGEGNSEPRSVSMSDRKRGKKRGSGGEGMLELAKAIEKMGEMYEKVEGARQRQMMEMEKQRMEFLKGLELQRMEMFADLKVQMEKLKRARRSSDAGYS